MNEISRPYGPASTAQVSRVNREAILALLLNGGPLSRPRIGELTGLSPATVSRLVASLMAQGLVEKTGRDVGTGGRPSVLVALREDAAVVATLRVERHSVAKTLIDLGANVSEREDVQVAPDLDVERRIDEVVRQAKDLVEKSERLGRNCVGLGVSVPGVVDQQGRVDWAPGLGWGSVPLGRVLSQHIGIPTVIENDANALVLAEFERVEVQGAETIAAVNLTDDGIGAGIILAGRLFRGVRGAAGEIGYMLSGTDALQRRFPRFGDLEQRMSRQTLACRAAEVGVERASGIGDPDSASLGATFALAHEGSAHAQHLLDSLLDNLTFAIANLCVVIDPEVVVLAGELGAHADAIVRAIQQRLAGRIPHVPRIIGSTCAADGPLLGVGRLAFEHAGPLLELVG